MLSMQARVALAVWVVAALAAPAAPASNSTASWLAKRAQLIDDVLGYGLGVMPSRSVPDAIEHNVAPGGVAAVTWNLTTRFEINSTVFFAPLSGDPSRPARRAFVFHHGHSNCDCPDGTTPLDKARCRPGCKSLMPLPSYNQTGYTWWDLYNVSAFFHSLGYDVFIVSMPLKGVNLGPGSSGGSLNTDHWWFLPWEQQGDHALRYFLEPVFLTINYATEVLGIGEVHMAGLSGGGWTTTFASAMDTRIQTSFPIAGSIPCGMRNPNAKSWPWGNDQEDFEQNCSPNPNPGKYANHPGRVTFQACNYTCQYLLAGLEPGRSQTQILHEYDSCCFAPHNRHDQMLAYERSVREELGGAGRGGASLHGWFTSTADNHTKHEVCHKDKRILASVMAAGPGGFPAGSPAWAAIPCDILHNAAGFCPELYPPAHPNGG